MNRSLSEVDPQIVQIMPARFGSDAKLLDTDPFGKLRKPGGHANAGEYPDQ